MPPPSVLGGRAGVSRTVLGSPNTPNKANPVLPSSAAQSAWRSAAPERAPKERQRGQGPPKSPPSLRSPSVSQQSLPLTVFKFLPVRKPVFTVRALEESCNRPLRVLSGQKPDSHSASFPCLLVFLSFCLLVFVSSSFFFLSRYLSALDYAHRASSQKRQARPTTSSAVRPECPRQTLYHTVSHCSHCVCTP